MKIQLKKVMIAKLCEMSKIQKNKFKTFFPPPITWHYHSSEWGAEKYCPDSQVSLLSDQSHTALTLMEGANLFSSVTKDLCIFKDVYLLLSSIFTFSLNFLKENPKDANKKY